MRAKDAAQRLLNELKVKRVIEEAKQEARQAEVVPEGQAPNPSRWVTMMLGVDMSSFGMSMIDAARSIETLGREMGRIPDSVRQQMLIIDDVSEEVTPVVDRFKPRDISNLTWRMLSDEEKVDAILACGELGQLDREGIVALLNADRMRREHEERRREDFRETEDERRERLQRIRRMIEARDITLGTDKERCLMQQSLKRSLW